MITILDIGMNHETAPVELRECIAREPESASIALASMRELSSIREGLFLSTCNRVEALCITEQPKEARESVISLLSHLGNVPEAVNALVAPALFYTPAPFNASFPGTISLSEPIYKLRGMMLRMANIYKLVFQLRHLVPPKATLLSVQVEFVDGVVDHLFTDV